MIIALQILNGIILCVMIAATTMAGMKENIFAIPHVVQDDPWFKATLFDTYFAFLQFFLWVCYRERSNLQKMIWFIAIALLGNIAMSIYALLALRKLKPGDGVEKLFSRQ